MSMITLVNKDEYGDGYDDDHYASQDIAQLRENVSRFVGWYEAVFKKIIDASTIESTVATEGVTTKNTIRLPDEDPKTLGFQPKTLCGNNLANNLANKIDPIKVPTTGMSTAFGHFQRQCSTLGLKPKGLGAVNPTPKTRKESFTHRKWMKIISEYYIDKLNSDVSLWNKIDKILVWRTEIKTGIDKELILKIFESASKEKYKLLYMKPGNKNADPNLQISLQEQESLTLRYYIPLQSGGHFLSMDRELYKKLSDSSRLPVIECYASPYNNNLKQYCSLFPQDKKHGALSRFDLFIDNVDIPCRLIANPPYTISAITVCISKIIEYMSRQRGEFIAFLPLLHNFPDLNDILTYKNTSYVLLQGDTYPLYSFVSNKYILNPMQLYIIANISGSSQESHRMVNDIAYHLRNKAMTITNDS